MATHSPINITHDNTHQASTNERTRIVHFTNTRKQMILSPSQTHSRLPSTCSMSSLISEDTAPLASIETEREPLSSPRRSSVKSGDGNKTSARSSSTGRILDEKRLSNLLYAAIENRDRAVPAAAAHRKFSNSNESFGDATPTNESFPMDFFTSGSLRSNNSEMDEQMYRNTLGSWSRSRRKPQNDSLNTSKDSSLQFKSSTLPLKGGHRAGAATDTLVKSRKRYTWLSNKQTLSQGPIAARSPTQQHVNGNHIERTNSSLDNSSLLLPNKNAIVPSKVANKSVSRISPSVSKKNVPISSPTQNNNVARASPNLSTKSCSDSPKLQNKIVDSINQQYNWKRDPRRRPCNFGENNIFDIASVGSSSNDESVIGRDETIIGTDRDTSCNESIYSNYESNIGQYTPPTHAKANTSLESGFSSYTSHASVSEKCNNTSPANLPHSSPRWSPSKNAKKNPKSERDSSLLSYKATTPVDDIDDVVITSNFSSNSTSDHRDALPHSYSNKINSSLIDNSFSNDLCSTQPDNTRNKNMSPQHQPLGNYSSPKQSPRLSYHVDTGEYRDCLVRESLSFRKQGSGFSSSSSATSSKPLSPNLERTNPKIQDLHNVTAPGDIEMYSGGEIGYEDKSPEEILKSPRSRASFQLAVGSNWDLMPEKEVACSKLSQISESPHCSPQRHLVDSLPRSHCEEVFTNEVHWNMPGGVVVNNSTDKYDSLTRKIKRNSMRLATASVSDITCALDDIDIGEDADVNATNTCPPTPNTSPHATPMPPRTQTQSHTSPIISKSNLHRTGSLLSSQLNTSCSSYGSFYSCQSKDKGNNSPKPSPNTSMRQEIRSRFESPNSLSRHLNINTQPKSCSSSVAVAHIPTESPHHNHNSRSASPVSLASSGRSSQRHKPAYFWTRQAPYPRTLFARSGSVASYSGPYTQGKPRLTSSSSCQVTRFSSSKSAADFSNGRKTSLGSTNFPPQQKTNSNQNTSFESQQAANIAKDSNRSHNKQNQQQTHPSRTRQFADRRSLTLPVSSFSSSSSSRSHPFHYTLNPPYHQHVDRYNQRAYSPDLSPSSVLELDLESPNNPVLSPPSLGRPKRKQYAGFDCQPLPMESYVSDSSSVYTCLSCSSLATDITSHPNDSQMIHDASFISDDVHVHFEGDRTQDDINVRLSDASFDSSSQIMINRQLPEISQNLIASDKDEPESKRSSIHSESTTKQDNDEDALCSDDEDKGNIGDDEDADSCHDSSFEDVLGRSDGDFINSKQAKQLGSGYHALFRLYKSDDLFTTTPSSPIFSQDGKAFSSSCLLRSQLYSKRKFLSARDLFELMKNPDKAHRLDTTVSLTSLERHAHKVCEAILCCDEMNPGYFNRQSLI